MSNKKNAIMLADTRPALVGTVLLQLKNTNDGLFDEAIIYYTDSISEKDKELMRSIMPCRFVEYQPPLPEYLFEKPRFKRFSVLMFCRYEMFTYLDEFDTITWIDTDILIQGDLEPLILAAEVTGAAMIREDPLNKTAENADRMRTCFTTDLAGYKMDEYLYPSGTIVFSPKINGYENYTKWCYQKTVEWADVLSLPDQGVINAAIQQFNMKVTPVSGKEYCCYPYMGRDCSEAKIIHAWGSNKFWNDWFVYLSFPEWRNYYEKWLGLGGTSLGFEISPQISVVIPSYKPSLKLMKQCLDSLRNQNRANWERFSNFEIIIVAEPFEKEALQELVDSYKDPRIRLHFNDERKGIAASLNVGMRFAKGKYIARVDDDDVCETSRLYLQAGYLDRNSEITLCTSDFEYFGDMNEWRLSFEGEMSKAWSIFTCPFDHPTIMFRKDFFVNNDLFYDEQRGYVEDWELWRRAFKKGMTVGCIHKVLFYHRWLNTGSAGQTSKTVDMMRELVQKNFAEIGVQILKEDLPLIGPWNGRLEKEADLDKLARYFEQALEQNKICKQYDQNALQEVFRLRLEEAKTGILPGLSRKIVKHENANGTESMPINYEPPCQPSALRQLAKKLLKPFYRPFRHRYEDRLIEMMRTTYTISDQLNRLQAYVEAQDQKIAALTGQLNEQIRLNTTLLNARICDEAEDIRKVLGKQAVEEAENTRQTLRADMRQESEDTRQTLRADMHQESENIRQTLSANMYIESENTRQMLSGKIYGEHENTRHMVERKLYEENQGVRTSILDELHRHIDFTYRDILVALEKQSSFLPKNDIKLITEYPIAYESLDYLYPHGTIRDNTRHPRFVEKCEEVLGQDAELSFLDLGCSGGGMVLEAALRGHVSVGLEGSNSSKREQRAEWRLLGDRLQTCDITKPFRLVGQDDTVRKFDIITAWEVMEHIQEKDLPQMLENIKLHLSNRGYFVASIANWEDIDSESGINWHVTLHEFDWWVKQFEQAGFEVHNELFQPIDMARGTYNPPHCYEMPYSDYNKETNFYIVVSLAKNKKEAVI